MLANHGGSEGRREGEKGKKKISILGIFIVEKKGMKEGGKGCIRWREI